MSEARACGEDLFLLHLDDGRPCLYAPLRRSAAVVNQGAVAAVRRYIEAGDAGLTEAQRRTIQQLERGGLLGGPAPAPPVFPEGHRFCPHEVTLFLTSRCNLRCRYCYAEAGKKQVEMPWSVARAAVDLAARNAGLLGSPRFAVGFHGGGEPTVAWELLVQCTEHALRLADAKGLEVELFSATNGLLSPAQREYIIRHFGSVNVSLDGPADIQDHNRPRLDGSGSHREVHETLERFNEAGMNYGIRATITAATASRMVEIVEHLCERYRFRYLQLEPVWLCGRCSTSGERPPSDEQYVRHFDAAVRRGRELGVAVTYSGARLDVLTSKFCAAAGDSFTVLPEGVVTSCYEVTEPDDPRAATFHYGRHDAEAGAFTFDEERLEALGKLSVEHLTFCEDCFCKWHCAGDCLAKALDCSGDGTHQGSPRCNLNRTLTLSDLQRTLLEAEAEAGSAGHRGGANAASEEA